MMELGSTTSMVLAQVQDAVQSSDKNLLERLVDGPHSGWFFVFTFVIIVVLIKSVTSVLKTNARERTRREIAAYIAEGSMTPDQGEKLMNAGPKTEC